MTHRFPIKEIAQQAGLGTATVDRVLNNRAHVSPQTRARVHAAMGELEAQEHQLAARGRRMFVDVVVEAPRRFSVQIEAACAAALADISGAVLRPRFLFQETMTERDVTAALKRIQKRGSHGVLLKARDIPSIRTAVQSLEDGGIPVVTLVTDIGETNRTAYVGIDNAKAGQTAGYLLASVLTTPKGTVLTSSSQEDFQGEVERLEHFLTCFSQLRPDYKVVAVAGGAGLSGGTKQRLSKEFGGLERVDAVYSMGGGNRAILESLRAEGLAPQHFVAHDLDRDNLALLEAGKISFVLHHDLQLDMTRGFQALASRHGLANQQEGRLLSDVHIITPYNIPRSFYQ
ncbi:MAG: LacI family DNA-binding transcriptional regulator [Pseudomonadota bacterium]